MTDYEIIHNQGNSQHCAFIRRGEESKHWAKVSATKSYLCDMTGKEIVTGEDCWCPISRLSVQGIRISKQAYSKLKIEYDANKDKRLIDKAKKRLGLQGGR